MIATSSTTVAEAVTSVAPLPAYDGDPLDDRAATIWSWRFVWLGLAVRVLRYLTVFPLWQDEQLVALNISFRDYAGLLKPLDLHQVAPLGFLLGTKWLTQTFGFNEYTLRGLALVCGCGGLLLFRSLAAQLLRRTALVSAVAVFALAYFPIRHSAEVKPYACDLFCAVLLLRLAVWWRQNPTKLAPPLALIAATIATLPFSFPAIFVVGGISIAMLPSVLRRREARYFATYVVFNLAALAVFGGLLRLAVNEHFEAATTDDFMYSYWDGSFPPPLAQSLKELWAWPWWFINVHAGEGMAYPIGSKKFGSVVSTILALVGVFVMLRRGRTWLSTVTATTLGLGLIAAALGRYPYGHGERLQQYWAPFICCLMGAGIAAGIACSPLAIVRRRGATAMIAIFILLGLVWGAETQLRPYKHRYDREHQGFSRWFWRLGSNGAPQLCLTGDFGRPLFQIDRQKSYLVYRDLSRRVPTTQRERLAAVPSGVPIEAIAFTLEGEPLHSAPLNGWKAAMEKEYRLVDERQYTVMIDDKPGKRAIYHVWRWEPLSPQSRPESAASFEPYPIY